MPARHMLLAAAVAVAWGFNFVVVHVGLESFPPLLFAALRFTLVALPAVFFVRRPPIPWRAVALVGLFLSTGQFALLFVAMDQGLPAGLASLVLQVQALFTVGLAVLLLGERPVRAQLAGGALALGGIAVIALGRGGEVPLIAILLAIGAAASWGAGNIATRVAQAPDPIPLIVWSSLVPPIPLLGLSLAFEGPREIGSALAGVDASGLLALAYVILAASFFGYGVWTWLLRRHPASTVAPFSLLVPVAGIGSAWIALGEQPNGAELAGAAAVLGGIAVASGVLRRRPALAPVPAA